ncbi:MAG: hypothetical protein M0C28_22850 [Candidatus Moduliflexus flocculans]|nr:hypothetical protein [Candidatus Moduliflexus flocculans]
MLTRIYAYAFGSQGRARGPPQDARGGGEARPPPAGQGARPLLAPTRRPARASIYWHPKGGRFRVALENWWRDEHYENGYEILFTPHIGKSWLWETSGHLGFYKAEHVLVR